LTLSECLLEAPHGRIAVVLADTWRHLVRPWRVTCSILSGSRTRLSSPTPPATTSRGSPRRSADRLGASRHVAGQDNSTLTIRPADRESRASAPRWRTAGLDSTAV